MAIQLIDLKKQFGDKVITNGLNLTIPKHKMTVIIGRSGEGKSLLLKQIMGLVQPTSGKIVVDGTDVTVISKKEHQKILSKFGYVFQFAALLDSLTVLENVGISLLEQGVPLAQIVPIVKEKLSLVHLSHDTLYKYPCELSGGMKKRVGLARTLVTNPEIILYDEPTTGLDPITTRIIHELIYSMQQQLGLTSIVISHDLEVLKYADKVALLHEGKIQFFGDAGTIWQSANPYVHQFIRGLTAGPIGNEFTEGKVEIMP
jgi:phospholipid/cholesterol/gamma-HCH transport system ATP-binding protein